MSSPSVRIIAAWEGALAEQDWNEHSQVCVLRDFIDTLVREDPLVAEKFERYLDERIDTENGLLTEEPDDEDEDEEEGDGP